MKTAVDSSVLIDVLHGDPEFGAASSSALRRAYDEGALVACDVVWAEVRARFASDQDFVGAMKALGVTFEEVGAEASLDAGSMWRTHARGRTSPRRLIADFLIGAHARRKADRLLTRDRGFYRVVFRGLRIIDPSE